MQPTKCTALALVIAMGFAPACGTRTGVAVAGGTLLTGLVMSVALHHDNYNAENAFRPTDEIVGNLLVLVGAGMLLGNLAAANRPRVTKPVSAPLQFAAPSRAISSELRSLTKLALQAARSNLCEDARGLTLRAAAIDAAYVEASIAKDEAMQRCAEQWPQR